MATVFHPFASAGVGGCLRRSSEVARRKGNEELVRARDQCIPLTIPSSVSFSSSSAKILFSKTPNSYGSSISTNSGLSSVSLRSRNCRRRSPVVVFSSDNGKQSGEIDTSDANVEALEAKAGIGRRARKLKQGTSEVTVAEPEKPKAPAKTWEAMSFPEKAWSLYIDPEKGLLFWLNKLAYGAIFAIIGGWIVFRFIGPALGLYELDQQLLSPARLLDDSP